MTETRALAWCDDFRARIGEWPSQASGIVLAAVGEIWHAINEALRNGHRGLPGGLSLAKLLAAHRGKRNRKDLPLLTEGAIAALADIHHAQNCG